MEQLEELVLKTLKKNIKKTENWNPVGFRSQFLILTKLLLQTTDNLHTEAWLKTSEMQK